MGITTKKTCEKCGGVGAIHNGLTSRSDYCNNCGGTGVIETHIDNTIKIPVKPEIISQDLKNILEIKKEAKELAKLRKEVEELDEYLRVRKDNLDDIYSKIQNLNMTSRAIEKNIEEARIKKDLLRSKIDQRLTNLYALAERLPEEE